MLYLAGFHFVQPHPRLEPRERSLFSISLCLCLTHVWHGLLSPWCHQSLWGPVKAIPPLLSLCHSSGCVSNKGLTHSPTIPLSRPPWEKKTHRSPDGRPHLHGYKSLTKWQPTRTAQHKQQGHQTICANHSFIWLPWAVAGRMPNVIWKSWWWFVLLTRWVWVSFYMCRHVQSPYR